MVFPQPLAALLALLLFFAASISANTPIPDAVVRASLENLNNRGLALALASRPMWHFASMRPVFFLREFPTCYPIAALTAAGKQHGTEPNKWPDAGTGCASPGPQGRGNPFPTYWSVVRCSGTEVRVVYSVYYQHDGFSNVVIAKGHMHDWERVVVVWTRSATTKEWTRARLLKSMHSGYQARAWGDVESTFNYDKSDEFRGKNKDGAKIYVGWGKHPNFDTKETGWRDSISQGCQREFRNGDWWFLPGEAEMVWAAAESPEGKRLAKFSWGSATGGPWVAEAGICGKGEGGFTPC